MWLQYITHLDDDRLPATFFLQTVQLNIRLYLQRDEVLDGNLLLLCNIHASSTKQKDSC